MARWVTDLVVSVLSIGAIVAGGRYAIAREAQHRIPLQRIYEDTNNRLFAGRLTNATVQWADLTDKGDRGETVVSKDGSITILLDRAENLTEADVTEAIRHESCHVEIGGTTENQHGPEFQDCMSRYKLLR